MILLVVMLGLGGSEILSMCITGLVTGGFSAVQGIGFMVALAGGVAVFQGGSRVRWLLALVVAALGAVGAYHLVGVHHDLNLHSSLLGVQSSIRVATAAALLVSRDVTAFCDAARARLSGGSRQ